MCQMCHRSWDSSSDTPPIDPTTKSCYNVLLTVLYILQVSTLLLLPAVYLLFLTRNPVISFEIVFTITQPLTACSTFGVKWYVLNAIPAKERRILSRTLFDFGLCSFHIYFFPVFCDYILLRAVGNYEHTSQGVTNLSRPRHHKNHVQARPFQWSWLKAFQMAFFSVDCSQTDLKSNLMILVRTQTRRKHHLDGEHRAWLGAWCCQGT